MNNMFQGCKSLVSIDFSKFDTRKVIKMNNMFQDCSSLTSLDISNFNTENVINMDYMFSDCSSLRSINFKFNTSNVLDMSLIDVLN